MSIDYPIEALAQSLHAACLRDLPEIKYRDRDWAAHRAMMDKLSKEEKAAHYAKEKASGQSEGHFIEKVRRPSSHDCEVVMFPQTWSSTALGFGGIGGQAFTSAYTVIVSCDRAVASAVYFGGRFAYLVEHARQNHDFKRDIANQTMADCGTAGRRYVAQPVAKVLAQAIAMQSNPDPEFRGVDYGGLTVRYTQDPAPSAGRRQTVAWLIRSKSGLIRAALTDVPTKDQFAAAECDGDEVVPVCEC